MSYKDDDTTGDLLGDRRVQVHVVSAVPKDCEEFDEDEHTRILGRLAIRASEEAARRRQRFGWILVVIMVILGVTWMF